MGVTGMYLYFYLFTHLVGNFGMFAGAEKYNKYGYLLLHQLGEIIFPIEMSLIVALIVHVFLAIKLTIENRAARPVAYAITPSQGRKTLYSVTMMLTGSAILLFAFVHIAHFRYGAVTGHTTVTYDGVEMRDLYGTMMNAFSIWWYSLSYVIVMIIVAGHLAHGVQSSFQSLGFNHPKYRPMIIWFGRAYAVLISGGFSFMAIWGYFQHGGTP